MASMPEMAGPRAKKADALDRLEAAVAEADRELRAYEKVARAQIARWNGNGRRRLLG